MTEQQFEALHRAHIFELNEGRGQEIEYYRDVNVEGPIRLLVELLNSPWTFTTASCGGHWEDPPLFQYPYVVFRIIDRPKQWRRIVRAACNTLKHHVSDRATLYVSEGYSLPATDPGWTEWRFQPARSGRFRDARKTFRDEKDFRSALDRLIREAQLALLEAMVKRIG